MGVETLDVGLMSAGNGFLRLNDFEVVGYAGGEAILRLGKSLLSQIDGTAGDLDLLGGGTQVQQRGTDFKIDASAQVGQLRTGLLQLGVSFENITVNFPSGKDGDGQASIHLPGSIRVGRGYSGVAVVRVDVERGK